MLHSTLLIEEVETRVLIPLKGMEWQVLLARDYCVSENPY